MTSHKILAIDQGTTSSRAIVFSDSGEVLSLNQKELTLFYPQDGWVEQDAAAIWADTLEVARACLAAHPDITGIGITNQRETTILWDRTSGKPVHRAIVWQDRRTADRCRELREQGHEALIRARTGLLLDPYFAATKIAWLLNHVPGLRQRAERGEIAAGTVDSWLLWNLTGGKVHKTDATNASRTMLYDLVRQQWDDELLKLFDIPSALLPEVCDTAAAFGITAEGLFPGRYPIAGMAGDQQAALIGQACFKPGMVKSTYGTGCFVLMNIGDHFRESQNRLLTTIAYRFGGKPTYAVEGSIFIAGAAIQWLRDGLGFFPSSADSEALARSVPDSHGVYFVPAFTGLGAPYWEPQARGAIFGLTRDTTRAHLTRAALEAQAFQTLDLMEAMEKDGGHSPSVIRADGGLTANRFMCQFLADMLGKPVDVPINAEMTAYGAAQLAFLQLGLKSVLDPPKTGAAYAPSLPDKEREQLYAGWTRAIRAVLAGSEEGA